MTVTIILVKISSSKHIFTPVISSSYRSTLNYNKSYIFICNIRFKFVLFAIFIQ